MGGERLRKTDVAYEYGQVIRGAAGVAGGAGVDEERVRADGESELHGQRETEETDAANVDGAGDEYRGRIPVAVDDNEPAIPGAGGERGGGTAGPAVRGAGRGVPDGGGVPGAAGAVREMPSADQRVRGVSEEL
jgi:hypothetical protein